MARAYRGAAAARLRRMAERLPVNWLGGSSPYAGSMSPGKVQVAGGVQAALLLDVGLRPLLNLLMQDPRSAGEVATLLGVGVQRAHYLLGKLERAGVARVVELRPRAGRAVKRYGVAPRWFIPYEVTGAETLEAFLGAQIVPRVERFNRLAVGLLRESGPDWGYWLEGGEEGSTLRMGGPGSEAYELFIGDEPFLLNIGGLRLSRKEAGELKRRLLAVMEEFQARDTAEAPLHTVALLLVRGDVG